MYEYKLNILSVVLKENKLKRSSKLVDEYKCKFLFISDPQVWSLCSHSEVLKSSHGRKVAPPFKPVKSRKNKWAVREG